MTTLRFLNGTKTIGGNIVEIAKDDSRVIMDFGLVADVADNTPQTIQKAMAAHQLPRLPELLLPGQKQPYRHQAIFISHLHLDHMGALRFLNHVDIPIYLSQGALALYKILIEQGIEAPVRNLHALADQEKVQIGKLTVQALYSDHDTIDPMALLTTDGQHTFLHSGDVRLDGQHPERVSRWCQHVQNKVDVYFTEATTYSFASEQPQIIANGKAEPTYTEASLQTAFQQQLTHHEELLVLNPYPRNVERLIAFNQNAYQAGRPVLWEEPFAEIIHHFAPTEPLHVLQYHDEGKHPDWRQNPHIITKTWSQTRPLLQQQPQSYVLQNSWPHLNELASFEQLTYLHSNGEPLGDYDPRFAQLQHFLNDHHFQLRPFGASGHAQKADILALAQQVNARRTVIWHSFKPERLAADLKETPTKPWLPELDRYYHFD